MSKNFLLFLAILIGLYVFYINLFPSPGNSIVGKPAPEFVAPFPNKPSLHLKNELGKKVILINFWATWCKPCREEIPILSNIHKQLDPSKFLIVSIMEDDAPSDQIKLKALNRFKQKIPINFPVYFDPNNLIADTYGTFKLPESYVIDLSGKIRYKHVGPITKWDKKDLLEIIRGLF